MKKKFVIWLSIVAIIVGLALYIRAKAITIKCETEETEFKGVIETDENITASSTLSNWTGDSKDDPAILGTSTTAFMADPISRDFEVSGIDSVCIYTKWIPSTTDAILNAKYYSSYDGSDWYAIDTINNSATTTPLFYNSSTSTISFFPTRGSTDERSKYVCPPQLQDLNINYLRVEYSRGTNLSGGKIFSKAVKKGKY